MLKKMTCFFSLFFVLFVAQKSVAQEKFKSLSIYSNKPIHSFGFSYKNNIFLPEKVSEEQGLVKRNPKSRYAFEVMLNYNLIIKEKWGVKSNIILLGIVPYGYHFNYKIKKDFSHYSVLYGVPYWGIDFLANYTFRINDRIFLQPELGLKFMFTPTMFEGGSTYYYASHFNLYEEDSENFSKIIPDLIANFNFLFHAPKAPKHNFLLGLSFNYGFVQRIESIYKIVNSGKYNSSGKASFGSTHFGINIGYQFIGLRKLVEKSTNSILFNPRF